MTPFEWGLIVGVLAGGFATAFVINQLHTTKINALTAQVQALTSKVTEVIEAVSNSVKKA